MREGIVPLLACPREQGEGRCGGALRAWVPAGLRMPARTSPGDAEDLLEAGLCCASCGAEYPILAGVAILVPDPERYVRVHRDALLRDLERHGAAPSPEARAWLERRYPRAEKQEEYGADFNFPQQFERAIDAARAVAPDPEALYGSFARWLEGLGPTPYDVLAGFAAEHGAGGGLFLDAGCGLGGLIWRAAPRFALSLGVDLSLSAVLLARRTLLGKPAAEPGYSYATRRGQSARRPLALPRLEGVEVVVGDCAALPFRSGLFDVVASCNVIDIPVGGPEPPLDEAVRALGAGGVLLVTNPFFFRDGEAPPGDPRAWLDRALEERGLRVAARRDGVPWVWPNYDRHWRVYFNYCVAARR